MAIPVLDPTGARDGRPAVPVPVVTYALIALNTLVFLLGPAAGLNPLYGSGQARVCAEQRYEQRWGVIPAELLEHRPLEAGRIVQPESCVLAPTPGKSPVLSVLSSLFVHASWLHLVGNMLFLYVFGAGVEERLGRARFVLFYLTVGALATYGYAIAEVHSADSTRVLVGASGAIAGVLGGYLRLYPKARVTTLVPLLLFLPLRFPAWLVLGLWFALQWWSVRSAGFAGTERPPGWTSVAYLVHVIGFAAGFLFTWAARAAARRGPVGPPATG
ncbi:rhomboid family intramembrane serine protease [Kitasatospora sp. NPDC057015]|uniref:rhomboid family intramembrane serine protease n=1 Tax=Kitasatospora sp. NPDC057015 TaxID=3346001 RepID=UPI00363DABBC